MTTNFYFYNEKESKKIPKEKISCTCLPIIILDSVLYAYEKYHLQKFLEECKYKQINNNNNNNNKRTLLMRN